MSLNKKKLYLQLGVESDEVIVDTDVPAENETLVAADLDAEADKQDLDNEVNELEEFTNATDGVDELSVAVEAAVASGRGLTKIEAAALTKALQSCAGRYIDIENNVVPATESYDVAVHDGRENTEHNKEQTKEASKGLKATLKAFIEAIIKKLKSVLLKFKNSWKAITDRMGRLEAKIKNAAKILENTPEFESQEVKFNSRNLYLDGGLKPEKLKAGIEEITLINNTFLSADFSSEESKFLDAGIKAVKESGGSNWDKFRDMLNGHTLTAFSRIAKNGKKEENGQYISPELLGGRHLVLTPGSEGGNELSVITIKRLSEGSDELNEIVKTPSKRELGDIVDDTFMMVTTFRQNFSRKGSMGSGSMDKVLKELGSYSPRNEAELSGDKKRLTDLSNFISRSSSLTLWLWDYNILVTSNIAELTVVTCNHVKGAVDKKKAEEEKTA